MNIEPIKKTIKIHRCISPAEVMYEDTGDFQIVRVRGADGQERDEERPVRRQIVREAVFKLEDIEVEVYQVNDGVDVHEFASLKAAEDFIRG